MAQNISALVTLLATTIGGDVKAINAQLAGLGDLSTLNTTHKASLVGAINEVNAAVGAIDLSSIIDDAGTGSTGSTLSASKIGELLTALKNEILGGAGSAFDTLKEIEDALKSNPDVIQGILDALAKRVRVDGAQTFSDTEKAQGRTNIGAASQASVSALEAGVGDYANADPVGAYMSAKAPA